MRKILALLCFLTGTCVMAQVHIHSIYFDAVLLNDGRQDTFTNVSAYDCKQWFKIKLK